jgi:ubiquinone/menaquinone biosynthesis C-methylase UbiE
LGWFDSEFNRKSFFRLVSPNANERILDVGAGKGNIAAVVQETSGSELHALDPDGKRIAFMRENHHNLKICLSGSDSIPYEDAFFDKVYSTMAVHHFPNQRNSFTEMARVLKPGGLLVVVEISPRTIAGRMARFFENGILRSHLNFLRPEELSEMLKKGGRFRVRTTERSGAVYFIQAVRLAAPPT